MKTPIKILVLDDDDAVRISLQSFFEDYGFTCFPMSSAEEAIEFLKWQPVDLAIVDLRLPGMDGMNFIRTTYMDHPSLKYIIFTGSVDIAIPEDICRLERVSKNLFIKPITNLEVFLKEVRQLMQDYESQCGEDVS